MAKQITITAKWDGTKLYLGRIKIAYYFASDSGNTFIVHSPVPELRKFNGKVNDENDAREICKSMANNFINKIRS